MSLISIAFFVFLLILLPVYFFVPRRYQWYVLLAGSFVFYLYGNWRVVGYLLVTIVSQYVFARKIDAINVRQNAAAEKASGVRKASIKKEFAQQKKKYLLAALLLNFGMLCFVKYTNFLLENLFQLNNWLTHSDGEFTALDIAIPLGISFYTFASVGYVIDVYRGKERAENNICKLALFVSFFPTIIQGPIERHSDLAHQLYEEHSFEYNRLCMGLQRMLWGYIKKLVIADRVVIVVRQVLDNYTHEDYGTFIIFGAVLLGGLRTYADFSGGMDIVCGLCEIMGIRLTENFRQPYMARSISEFWQRWHITLGAWVRRYVFYTITLSKKFNGIVKACRKRFGNSAKYIPATCASLIVFWIIGIWHGANWKYIAYGLYSAFFVATGTLFQDVYKTMKVRLHVREESKAWIFFQMVRTTVLVTFGKYLVYAGDIPDAIGLLKTTFTHFDPWVFFDGSLYQLGLSEKEFRFMMFTIVLLAFVDILKERGVHIRERIAGQTLIVRWTIYYGALLFLLLYGVYGPGYDARDFVYMHF